MNMIRNRIEKSKTDIKTWGAERYQKIQDRRQALVEQKEAVMEQGRVKVIVWESSVLDSARELLNKANTTLDERAPFLGERTPFLKKGQEALGNKVADLRAGHQETLPIPGFDDLSIKKIRPFLEDLNALQLKTITIYEKAHKNRVTLLRIIHDMIQERINPAPEEGFAA